MLPGSVRWLVPVCVAVSSLALGVLADAQPRKDAPVAEPAKAKAPKGAAAEPRTEEKAVESARAADEPGREDERKVGGKPASGGPEVVGVKSEGDAGVKTYQFGPVEVEGRLKSPQIIYFLRRVRAEFAAGKLGHRSFMRELSDTRRSSALR